MKAQMKNCYNAIFKNSNNSTKIALLSHVDELTDRYKEIFTLKDKFPMLFLIFDPREKLAFKWEKKFSKGAAKLSDEMTQLTIAEDFHLLHLKTMVVRSLRQLDDVLGKPLFGEIYDKYQGQFDIKIFEVLREGIEAVESYNYPAVFTKISCLSKIEMERQPQTRVHSNQLKIILNESLRQLMEEVRSTATFVLLRDDVSLEKVESMVKQLKLIVTVKNFIPEHPIIDEKIDEHLVEIKGILSNGILNQLYSIEKLINNRRFSDVVARKKTMLLVCNALGEFCEPKFFEAMEEIDKLQAKMFESFVDQYPDTKIKVDERFKVSLRNPFKSRFSFKERMLLGVPFFHRFLSIFSDQSTE